MTDISKIAIVGAATIRGKELNETLANSAFASASFSLMDEESQIGQLEAVGDEVTFIQRIEPSAFDGMDYVFFAGSQEVTRKHWKAAHKAGASIVDLSSALENEPGILVRAPWLDKTRLSLNTPAIVPAHPVAVALALLIARLRELADITSASATVLEPASEYGHAALDELHQQTVALLNFQSQPKAVYDTQVAFNIAPVLGPQAKADLRGSEARIRRHYHLLASDALPQVDVQLLQAPVFHGHGISLAVEFNKAMALDQVEAALGAEHIDVVMGDGDADVPNNLNTVGESDVKVRVRTAEGTQSETARFWLWATIDNLKFQAMNAIACAQELSKVRPKGKVQ
jgi:aspartate-semialdehyde dehydrogenase